MPSDLTPRKPPLLILGSGVGQPLRVLSAGVEHRIERAMVDLCFVFDTTGSMSDKIDGLIAAMVDFVRELASLALDWRVTVVPFGDLTVPGDRVVAQLPFVNERLAAERLLLAMPRFSGGGNDGESCLEAVSAALAKPYRAGAVKVLIVLTDEPALQGRLGTKGIERALREAEAITFVLSEPLPYYRHWAEATGGTWYDITASPATAEIVDLLRRLAAQVATVASNVHRLAGGSVSTYLQLPRVRSGSS